MTEDQCHLAQDLPVIVPHQDALRVARVPGEADHGIALQRRPLGWPHKIDELSNFSCLLAGLN
jgi:hypothetical protein